MLGIPPASALRAAQQYGPTVIQPLFHYWFTNYPAWSPVLHTMLDGRIIVIGMVTSGGLPLNLRESLEVMSSDPAPEELDFGPKRMRTEHAGSRPLAEPQPAAQPQGTQAHKRGSSGRATSC